MIAKHSKLSAVPGATTLAMLIWTAAVSPWRGHYGSPLIYPILIGAPVVVAWHIWLCVMREQKLQYILYAIINSLLYVLLALPEMMFITGDGI